MKDYKAAEELSRPPRPTFSKEYVREAVTSFSLAKSKPMSKSALIKLRMS
jgi:hypothetical protein